MTEPESWAPVEPPLVSEPVTEDEDDLEIPEITDFSGGVRGKYYERVTGRPLPIELDDDVRAVFPDAASVNEALRTLIRLHARDAV